MVRTTDLRPGMTGDLAPRRAPWVQNERVYRLSKRPSKLVEVGLAVLGESGAAAVVGRPGVAAAAADTGTGGRGTGGAERGARGVMALAAGAPNAVGGVGTVMEIDFPTSSPSIFLTALPRIA